MTPTKQFQQTFFKVLLATQETDFDDSYIVHSMWQWTNAMDGFGLMGFNPSGRNLWDEFYNYLQAFNHMGMKTVEDAQKAHDQFWSEDEDIELRKEDALHMEGERQTDRERE